MQSRIGFFIFVGLFLGAFLGYKLIASPAVGAASLGLFGGILGFILDKRAEKKND